MSHISRLKGSDQLLFPEYCELSIFAGAILMRERPNAGEKTRVRMTEIKISRKSNFKKKQLPFN